MSRKHGATWWSGRFLRSLERLGMTTRLRRGHVYFEEGRVLELSIRPGVVTSRVRGTEIYDCQIHFEPLSDMEWNESLERLAFDDLSAAALLTTGRMPPQIENVFAPSGRRLLPQGANDLEFHCTCPDRAIPCKHLAATAYSLAEGLDTDPWLLFLLRGRSASQVQDALTTRWNRDFSEDDSGSGPDSEESPVLPRPSEQNVDLFWGNHLKEPIIFSSASRSAISLTLERMAVPEPKIDDAAWHKSIISIYEQVSMRAAELLD